ncbi:MAG: TetR family transcriptional regulator C-terminal domain-containing protein, partial [Clostridia bacterium]|nr:TetR family transcriptional regulator C-terminal domain-containing protein [Clostridia bacterium]
HIDYHIEFFQAGFNAIVKKWLESGCKESPEEMENILKSEYRRNIQA